MKKRVVNFDFTIFAYFISPFLFACTNGKVMKTKNWELGMHMGVLCGVMMYGVIPSLIFLCIL